MVLVSELPLALLVAIGCVCVARANAIPAADPTITTPAKLPRQLDAAYIGWVKESGTWRSESCNAGGTWYQSGNYAQCCPETVTGCPAPTACIRGSQIYPFSGTTITTACTENFNNASYSICNTAFIYESFGDPNPKTDIICGDKSQVWSYYREIPASATQSSSGSSGSSSSREKTSSGSKAWIAGAVVGPIIGIALIALIAFFLLRRSKKNKNKQPNVPPAGAAGAAATAAGNVGGAQQQHYNYTSEAKPPLANPTTTQATYAQSPPGAHNNSYSQQGQQQGYSSQQGYTHGYTQQQQPTSPAPQYQQPYNNSAPNSPPPQQHPQPQQSAYMAQDAKMAYNAQSPSAAELGGLSSPVGGGYTAELSSETSTRQT